jgi:signal transduction histidine kinase
MRLNSLALRLIAASALWSAVALVVAGFILISLYRQAVERAFDDRLSVHLTTLVSAIAADPAAGGNGALSDPGNLGEPRFGLLYSGWYWQVGLQGTRQPVLTSQSLFSDILDLGALDRRERDVPRDLTTGALAGPLGQSLRVLERTIILDDGKSYEVAVAGDYGELEAQVAAFRNSVILTLAIFGAGLILAVFMQIRWGLRPLDRVRRGLANLRSGAETRFEGPFPAEIEPLAKELNALLESNQEVIERARTQVGNLAHALKTPLSVIVNEARAGTGPLAAKVAEQAELMRTQINHYLDRARIAASANVIGVVTDAAPVLERLARVMNRIHGDRGVTVSVSVPAEARFKGEQQDLEEIVGNLVDNACKWASREIEITATYSPPRGSLAFGSLKILIDDDGPGLDAGQMSEATRRGRRLDESKPGSGLGLSIVTDLVALYQGRFTLSRSPKGGLRAEIDLPAA